MCFVTAYYFFAGIRNFAKCSAEAGGFDSEVKQVAFFAAYTFGDCGKSFFHLGFVAVTFHLVEAFDLFAAYFCIVDFEDVDRVLMVKTVFVDTYDGLTA